jgi:hypothetical protein
VRTIILQNMIRDYVKTKRVRAALSIENEMMQRIPEVTTYTPLLVGWIH